MLALAALVVSIVAFFLDARRPPEPPTTTSIMLNGRSVFGEDAKDVLADAGARLFRAVTDHEDGAANSDNSVTAQADTPIDSGVLEIEARTHESAAERIYKRSVWVFVALGLTGAAIGGIAYRLGVRSGAVSIAIWPVWFIGTLALAVPSCAG